MSTAKSILKWEQEVLSHHGSLHKFTDRFTIVYIIVLTDQELERLGYVVNELRKNPALAPQAVPFEKEHAELKAFRERLTEAHPNADNGGKTRTHAR